MESKQELDLRALDAEVAEKVMQWSGFTHNGRIGYPPDADPHRVLPSVVPDYSTEIAAAMQVEDQIAELGLQKPYLQALGPIVAKGATEAGEILGYWHFTHATAEQRCRAALKALAEKES